MLFRSLFLRIARGMRHRPFATSSAKSAYHPLCGRQQLAPAEGKVPFKKIVLLVSLTFFAAAPVIAQDYAPGQLGTTGSVTQIQPNTTGSDLDVVTSFGATGADTVNSDSAAGGNANQPSRAVPNGSAGGGSGGSN